MAVNVTTLVSKSAELAEGALNYKALTDLRALIVDETSGTLLVDGESLAVTGANFTALLDEKVATLDSSISSLNTSLDTLADEIIVILAG